MKRTVFVVILATALSACGPTSRLPYNEPKDHKGEEEPIPVVPGEAVENWATLDPKEDRIEGTSVDKAYKELGLDIGETIVVAVIDSGVDISHPDLKEVIWTNAGESGLDPKGIDKATNGIDDDKNGYVDDLHGWNFLGNTDPTGTAVNIVGTTLEMTREKVRLQLRKAELLKLGQDLTGVEQALLDEVSAEVSKGLNEAQEDLKKFEPLKKQAVLLFEQVKTLLGETPFEAVTAKQLKELKIEDQLINSAREILVKILEENRLRNLGSIDRYIENAKAGIGFHFNEAIDPRKDVLPNDNPSDFTQRYYGNKDVMGPDADHGTHVAGLIAASRGNNIGIDGISKNVRIMPIRAVPDGDEYDKDVASAVRYAVENGARVINMSFGKSYSPYKPGVDRAFREAEAKGVVIVHAAGNSSQDNDVAKNFPNRRPALGGAELEGWLEVGASTHALGKELPAGFSNFGKRTVDLFSPGVNLVSTIPGNKYASYSGTSMASPVVAGVAALVLTQNPKLSAQEVRGLLKSSGRDRSKFNVFIPGMKELVGFKELSVTGAVVDAFAAIRRTLDLDVDSLHK